MKKHILLFFLAALWMSQMQAQNYIVTSDLTLMFLQVVSFC